MSVKDIKDVAAMSSQGVSEIAAAMGRHAEGAMTTERDLTIVTTEIKTLHQQAQQMVLSYAIEIGRRLVEAKALVEHGDWGRYIKEELDYSQSTANNFMRIFEEYGTAQQSLLGAEANSQALGNLTYTKALALLALPAEEREEFVETNDVEGMSSRELQQAIKERDAAKAALENEQAISADLRGQVELAENAKAEAEEKVERAMEAAEDAAKALDAAQEELEALKAKPIEVPVAQADPEKIQEAVDEALSAAEKTHAEKVAELEKKVADAKAAEKEAKKALKTAQEDADAIKAQAEAKAQAEVEAAKKQLAMAAPELTEFDVHYKVAQQEIFAMCDVVDRLQKDGHEKTEALRDALRSLLDRVTEVLG